MPSFGLSISQTDLTSSVRYKNGEAVSISSSSQRPASCADSRTQPIFFAISGADELAIAAASTLPDRHVQLTLTTSATRAARVRIRRLPPPIVMGGPPGCAGIGTPE